MNFEKYLRLHSYLYDKLNLKMFHFFLFTWKALHITKGKILNYSKKTRPFSLQTRLFLKKEQFNS